MKFNNLSLLLFTLLSIKISFAQSTEIKLPTSNSSSSFDINNSSNAQLLKINGDAGFFIGGNINVGAIPVEGEGSRLMWYPRKAAFRTGYAEGTQWNDANIGNFSVAAGINTIASNESSTALGAGTTANGENATAMGQNTVASGFASTTMGQSTLASGGASTAMGAQTVASGDYSTATGFQTTASGAMSTAMGQHSTASGSASSAIGYLVVASGNYSTAMGYYANTNNQAGSFSIGDLSVDQYCSSTAPNQMSMRFTNGYVFYTGLGGTPLDQNSWVGARLNANATSWSTISDSTRKENFILADGDYFLSSLSKLKLGSWNYKGQAPEVYRHYGPMAQEIFHYFGKDELGIIGNDTSLTTADMDGIIMICLQALEKRTAELKAAADEITGLKSTVAAQDNSITELKKELQEIKELILSAKEDKKSFAEYVNKKE